MLPIVEMSRLASLAGVAPRNALRAHTGRDVAFNVGRSG